jgi:hypothetical protein
MSYQQGGKIEAADINTHITNVNNILSDKGLNTLPSIAAGQVVRASDWSAVTDRVTNLANHHGATITGMNTPTSGGTASFINVLASNITAVNTAKRNVRAQGTTSTTTSTALRWSKAITMTQSVAFASATAAQYFFNAGGQISLNFTHPLGTGIDAIFNALAAACGTLVLSSPNSGTVSIVGTNYSGFQRAQGTGSGTPTTYLPNAGYYGLSATSQTLFYLKGGTYTNPAPGGGTYSANYIQVDAYTTASGATVNFSITWSESTTGGLLTSAPSNIGSQSTLTLRPPSTTDISGYYTGNPPWGTPTLTSAAITGS